MEEEYPDKSDIKTEADEVRRWLDEIELALKTEKPWRKDSERVWKVYRSESDTDQVRKDTFNILWANVEIKRQAIVNSMPIPDIRRRYNDDDPVGMNVCELLNRGVSYTLDCQEALHKLILCANDYLVPSRAQIRVRYRSESSKDLEPELADTDDENPPYEECIIEHVNWKEFFHGPGKEWDQVRWVGYEHPDVTREDAEKQFDKEKAAKLNYTKSDDVTRKDDHDSDKSVFARTTLYEIWDKDTRKVYWIGKDCADQYLEVVDDPLNLKNFFPSPRPVFSVEDPNSLIPIIEYGQYETLAKELEDITRRLLRLVRACKVRGIYDSRISEIERVFMEDDNALIAASNAAALVEGGGLEKAVWFMPLETIVGTIQALQMQRIAVKQQIDELNGMSDIVRGATNPNETATAQRIKANFASARLDKQKQAFQVFARDMIRLAAEVICGFSRETLSKMTGLKFPTNAEKQQQLDQLKAQMEQVMLQAQQTGQQPPQEMQQKVQQQAQQIQSAVTWEDLEEVLHSDMEREYRIDIETDSTIAADAQAEQEVYTSFMQGMAQFSTMAAQALQVGLLTQDSAKSMMVAFARKFRLGKDVEEELEKPLPPPPPDPEQQKMQAEMQMQQQEFQLKQQSEQQKLQMDQAANQSKLQFEQQKQALELQGQQAELVHKQKMMEMDLMMRQQEMAFQKQSLEMKNTFAEEDHGRKMKEKKSVAQ